jgi:hypothetical protein
VAETDLEGSVTDAARMVTMVLEAGFDGAVYVVEILLPDGLRVKVPHSARLHDAVQSTNGMEEGSFAICALNEIDVPGFMEAGGGAP